MNKSVIIFTIIFVLLFKYTSFSQSQDFDNLTIKLITGDNNLSEIYKGKNKSFTYSDRISKGHPENRNLASGKYDQILFSKSQLQSFNSINTDYLLTRETREIYFFDPPVINRTTFTYDEHGRNTEEFTEKEVDDEWQNDLKITRTFGDKDEVLEMISSIWENNNWKNSFRTVYSYNSDLLVTEQISYIWQSSKWTPSRKIISVYDDNGNIIEGTGANWNGSSWDNSSQQELYTYNTDGNLIEFVSLWNGENSFKATIDYDENGNPITQTEYFGNGNDWDASAQYTYEYDDNGNQISSSTAYWENEWSLYDKYDFEYNEFNNEVTSKAYLYEDGNWRHTFRSERTYDVNQNNIGYHGEGNYDGQGWWTSIRETREFQAFITSIEKHDELVPDEFSLTQNYPNPFNPTTMISFSLPNESNVSLKIFDISGKEVADLINDNFQSGNYSVSFDAGQLASGIYFYQLTADNFVQTRKMMLLK
jgi:hypothetical protein